MKEWSEANDEMKKIEEELWEIDPAGTIKIKVEELQQEIKNIEPELATIDIVETEKIKEKTSQLKSKKAENAKLITEFNSVFSEYEQIISKVKGATQKELKNSFDAIIKEEYDKLLSGDKEFDQTIIDNAILFDIEVKVMLLKIKRDKMISYTKRGGKEVEEEITSEQTYHLLHFTEFGAKYYWDDNEQKIVKKLILECKTEEAKRGINFLSSEPYTIVTDNKNLAQHYINKIVHYRTYVEVEEEKVEKLSDTIKIFITRTHTGINSTTGTLVTDDGTISGYTVELPRGTENECKTSCVDTVASYDCHCILEGVYMFEVNTKTYEEGNTKNHSLRIISTVPGRTGILVHGGQDDANGWSQGCILPMLNEPRLNLHFDNRYVLPGRNNTKDQSVDFTKTIINWVKQREAEIKKNNKDIKEVAKQIIITKTF